MRSLKLIPQTCRKIQVFLVCLMLFFAISNDILGDEFAHEFGPRTPDCAAFIIGFNSASKTVEIKKWLRLFKQAKEGPLDSQGVKTVFAIREDGWAELQFRCSELGKPSNGWGSGVQLRAEFNDREKTGLTIALQTEADGQSYVMTDFTTNGQAKHAVERKKIDKPKATTPCKLRFERISNQMMASYDVGNGLTTVARAPVSETDIFPIGVWVGSGGGEADLDITLESLRVVGATLPGDTLLPPSPYSLWRVAFWLCLILTIGLVGRIFYKKVANE
jgi:hypothetical protein